MRKVNDGIGASSVIRGGLTVGDLTVVGLTVGGLTGSAAKFLTHLGLIAFPKHFFHPQNVYVPSVKGIHS